MITNRTLWIIGPVALIVIGAVAYLCYSRRGLDDKLLRPRTESPVDHGGALIGEWSIDSRAVFLALRGLKARQLRGTGEYWSINLAPRMLAYEKEVEQWLSSFDTIWVSLKEDWRCELRTGDYRCSSTWDLMEEGEVDIGNDKASIVQYLGRRLCDVGVLGNMAMHGAGLYVWGDGLVAMFVVDERSVLAIPLKREGVR